MIAYRLGRIGEGAREVCHVPQRGVARMHAPNECGWLLRVNDGVQTSKTSLHIGDARAVWVLLHEFPFLPSYDVCVRRNGRHYLVYRPLRRWT
jgi:hypothetical protein